MIIPRGNENGTLKGAYKKSGGSNLECLIKPFGLYFDAITLKSTGWLDNRLNFGADYVGGE